MTTKPGALEANWRAGIDAAAAKSVRFSVPMPKRRLWNPGRGLFVIGLVVLNLSAWSLLIHEVIAALKGHV